MDLTSGITLLVIIYFIYALFIKGILWRLILGIFGLWGINVFLETHFENSKNTCMTIMSYSFSWAVVIPTIILLLTLATTKA